MNYTSATGTVVQDGTPTPENPIEPVFYQQGNMVLRKGGDYADSYDASTGKITRRVGVKVLDGTENWGIQSINDHGIANYQSTMAGMHPSSGSNSMMSSHFGATGSLIAESRRPGLLKSSGDTYFIRISSETASTVAQFKSWLAAQKAAGTPVTIYYVLENPVEEDWTETSYCETPIKIATTKYNETAFSPLNTALANAISVVDTVVSNTIAQAGKIATLQAQKQTRPANDTCPAYKQCLLVEDENGTPHWYEITDPFRDFVRPIIANNVAPASTTNSAGYTQLEYIESTGTQWIDTGIKWRYGYSLEIAFTPIRTGPNAAIFGASNGDAYNNGEVALFFQRDGYDVIWPTTGSMTSTYQHFGTFALNTKYVARYNNSGITIGQTSLGFSVYSGYVCERNLFLFATNRGEANKFFSQVKIHSTRIWNNNGELVRNFVPVKRNSDSAIGMYDTVTKAFFANAGTGTFTAGPTVANTDVPANGTWTATWAANATTGVSAGTITGEALCNGVEGTYGVAATSAQTSSADWSNSGASCWCRVTGVDDGDGVSAANGSWVFSLTRSSAGGCANSCENYCTTFVSSRAAFMSAVFGM